MPGPKARDVCGKLKSDNSFDEISGMLKTSGQCEVVRKRLAILANPGNFSGMLKRIGGSSE